MSTFVRITDPDNFEKSLKYWKKQCLKEGILEEIKKRRYFISKSQKKKQKQKENIKLLKIKRKVKYF